MRRRSLAALVAPALAAAALGTVLSAGSATAGTSAQKRVVVGSDGYLFIAQDWTVPCQDAGTGTRAGQRLDQLADALVAGGRDALTVIAPDKSTIRSGNVPSTVPQRSCAAAQKAALWKAATASDHFLDLRRPIAAAGSRYQTYWRKDTHWTPTSGGVYAHQVAKRLDPLLPARLTSSTRTFTRDGDLAETLGQPARETISAQQLANPQVTVRELAPQSVGLANRVRHTQATAGLGGRVVPGRTVFVGDSMDDVAVEQLAPLFADAVFVWVLDSDRLAPVMAQLKGADRVVLESVERFGARNRMQRDDALAAVRALPAR